MGLKLGDREGSGSHLPAGVLILAGVSTVVAVVVSAFSIYLHLKNYRKPALQRCVLDAYVPVLWLTSRTRMVVRIMVMIPIYAVASLISLFSLEAAFFIDAIRDVYEVRITTPSLKPALTSDRPLSSTASSCCCSSTSVASAPFSS